MSAQNQNINFPRHIGLIADGNRRWAKEHNLPKFEGHRRGFEAIKKIARAAQQKGIEMFTFWCFSTENWNRPAGEVAYLMDLFESSLDEFGKMAEQNKARLRIIGQKWRFRPSIQKKIEDVEKTTINNSGTILNMGLSYGGRDEIIQGIKKIIEKGLSAPDINEKIISENLWLPDIDLIIRTGGEQRLSGFLPWQAVYAELFFVKKYLPDFTPADFEEVLNEYAGRQRRFGR
mgnify:CR=1 FL=1